MGLVVFSLFLQLHGVVHRLVEIHCGNLNILDPVSGNVYEFRDIHGAIGHRRVLDQDGGRVVAVRINMRQEHLRIRRAAFGGKDQPAAVG